MKIFKYLLIVAIMTVSSVCHAQLEKKEIFRSTQVTQALKRSLDTNGTWRTIWLGEQATTPDAPPVGSVYLYAKTDDALYMLNSADVETLVAQGGIHNISGIDTVLAQDQVLTAPRFITGDNTNYFEVVVYDATEADYTSYGQLIIKENQVDLVHGTGDGMGGQSTLKYIQLNDTQMKVSDAMSTKGLEYAADYSTNFTDRSLVDKGYVDARGIDDVLALEQSLTANRSIEGNNAKYLEFVVYDKDTDTFDRLSGMEVRDALIIMLYGTGDGAGTFTGKKYIEFNDAQMLVKDTISTKGFEYDADYSTQFTDRSLVDKEYVDSIAAGANRFLSNLINPTSVNNDLFPDGDVTRDLGGPLQGWKDLYIGNIAHIDTLQMGTSTAVIAVLDEDNMVSDSPTALSTQQSIKAYVDSVPSDGIDDVLDIGQSLAAPRSILGENTNYLEIASFNLGPADFTTFSDFRIKNDNAYMRYGLGDGTGTITEEKSINFTNLSMLITDEIDTKGLEYAGDYSGNFTDRSLVDKEYVDSGSFTSALTRNVQSTGLISGMQLSATVPSTTYDIAAGTGLITNYSNPSNTTVTQIAYIGGTGLTPINLATEGTYVVGLDKDNLIVEFNIAAITNQNRRDNILIGAYRTNGTNVIFLGDSPFNLGYDGIASHKDFIRDVIGPANIIGNDFTANGANLTFDGTGGQFYIIASNFRIDPEVPDESTVAASSPTTFSHVYRQASPSTDLVTLPPTTLVDPTMWDDGSGTLQTVSVNDWTIQVIYIGPQNVKRVAYGQQVFNTLALAEDALLTGALNFDEFPVLQNLVRRTFLIVRQDATDLSNVAQATFFQDGKFRTGAISTVGGIPSITNPGGVDTDVQFNDAGTFGGDSNLQWNKTTNALAINGTINDATIEGTLSGNKSLWINTPVPTLYGENNNGIGDLVLGSLNNASAINNTAVGDGAMKSVTNGSHNTVFGATNFEDMLTGSLNIAIGYENGVGWISGSSNILLGSGIVLPTTTISNYLEIQETIFGDLSTKQLRIGGGLGAVVNPHTGSLYVVGGAIVGDTELWLDEDGSNNNIYINSTLPSTIGTSNIAIGLTSLNSINNVSAIDNIGIGVNAGTSITSGKENTIIGANAGATLTTGDRNILIGFASDVELAATSNYMNIGNNALQANLTGPYFVFGEPGLDVPSGPQTLTVVGSMKIGDNTDVFMDGDDTTENLFIGEVTPSSIGDEVFIIGFNSGTNISATATEMVLIGDNVAPNLLFDSRNNVMMGHDIMTGLTLGTVQNIAIGRMPVPNVGNAEDNVLIGDSIFGTDTLTLNNNVVIGNAIANSSVTNERSILIGHKIDDTDAVTAFTDSIMIGHDITALPLLNGYFLNIGDFIFGDIENGRLAIGGPVAKPTENGLRVTGLINGMEIAGGASSFSFAEAGNDILSTDTIRLGAGALGNAGLTGDQNIGIGTNAGNAMTSGNENTLIGLNAGTLITTGFENVLIGHGVMDTATGATSSNVVIGHGAANDLITGDDNVIIGENAGNAMTSGDDNIFLGHNALSPPGAVSDFCSIGGAIMGDMSGDRWVIGGNTVVPTGFATLELDSSLKCLLLNRVATTNSDDEFTVAGQIWYDTTANEFRGVENGTQVSFDTTTVPAALDIRDSNIITANSSKGTIVNVIKELAERIEALESPGLILNRRIDALEAQNKVLRGKIMVLEPAETEGLW